MPCAFEYVHNSFGGQVWSAQYPYGSHVYVLENVAVFCRAFAEKIWPPKNIRLNNQE